MKTTSIRRSLYLVNKVRPLALATCAALVAAGATSGATYLNRERVTLSYDHNGVNESGGTNTPVLVHQTTADMQASGGMQIAYGHWAPTWQDMFVARNSQVYASAGTARRDRVAEVIRRAAPPPRNIIAQYRRRSEPAGSR